MSLELNQLPEEILQHILQHFTLSELLTCLALICKQFKRMVSDPCLKAWWSIDFIKYKLGDLNTPKEGLLLHLISSGSLVNLHTLAIDGLACSYSMLGSKLESLTITNLLISNEILDCLATYCPYIRVLCVMWDPQRYKQVVEAISNFKHLEELYIPNFCDLAGSNSNVSSLHAKLKNLKRINLQNGMPLLGSIDLLCGICNAILYKGLSNYARSLPTQAHIETEIYTNTPPIKENISLASPSGRKINCKKNCHRKRWLIDNKTGLIELHGYQYGLACGPGLTHIVGNGITIKSNNYGSPK